MTTDRFMDPLHFCIALGPLALYFLLIGGINLFKRPFVTTGARDIAALAVGISGLIIAGPMELFLPETAAWQFGGSLVWLLLLLLYFLGTTLLVLLLRPRIVIYNVTAEQLRPVLSEIVGDLDPQARWAGACLVLPNLGVQLHVESLPPLKNTQLVAAGSQQNYAGWRKLEVAMAKSLSQQEGNSNPYAYTLLTMGLVLVALVATTMATQSDTVAQDLREMLRM
ncbi:MAG: hypothetical protein ACI9G1_001572 [Pirellulaceae bacterium]|jgi:hypothetical protein